MKIGGKLLERKTGGRSRYWQVFWLCFAVAAALFLPHCIIDGLNGDFFHYAGDFNDQQISFYSYANNFVKQGGSFSWATDLGNGFAFVARQKHFQVGNSDFYADLILYSIPLHAYIVVELKATPFKPEYAGQLNFYINVVDDKLRGENDNKTIGLLLCKGKDEVVAQYALTGYDQPIGISDYQLSKAIPENLKSALPSIEEVEEELTSLLDKDKNP